MAHEMSLEFSVRYRPLCIMVRVITVQVPGRSTEEVEGCLSPPPRSTPDARKGDLTPRIRYGSGVADLGTGWSGSG